MSTAGWAIRRNNSCYTSVGEIFCQKTVFSFNACCPPDSSCPSEITHNSYCCAEAGQNCEQTLIDTGPYCANSSWVPYIASDGGPFCCDPDEQGLSVDGTGAACAPFGYVLESGEQYLNPVRAAAKPSSSPSASPSVQQPMPEVTQVQQQQHSSVNTGAIVGGIVGGVGGIVILAFLGWWLVRRHDKRGKQSQEEEAPHTEEKRMSSSTAVESPEYVAGDVQIPIEVGGTPKVELEGSTKMP